MDSPIVMEILRWMEGAQIYYGVEPEYVENGIARTMAENVNASRDPSGDLDIATRRFETLGNILRMLMEHHRRMRLQQEEEESMLVEYHHRMREQEEEYHRRLQLQQELEDEDEGYSSPTIYSNMEDEIISISSNDEEDEEGFF